VGEHSQPPYIQCHTVSMHRPSQV